MLADIGDEQSIAKSLSTFSAHVQRLCLLLDEAAPDSLILLDELASGTDPEEGAALAAAMLEALTARGSAVAVTTHYEKLKEFAAHAQHLQNASVSYDFERMAPTFRLTMGIPGASSALTVATRHGLPSSVVARAQALLPEQSRERERAVERLERAAAAASSKQREAVSARSRRAPSLARARSPRSTTTARDALEAELERETLCLTRQRVQGARRALGGARAPEATKPRDPKALAQHRARPEPSRRARLAGRIAPARTGGSARPAPPVSTPSVSYKGGDTVRVKSSGLLATVRGRGRRQAAPPGRLDQVAAARARRRSGARARRQKPKPQPKPRPKTLARHDSSHRPSAPARTRSTCAASASTKRSTKVDAFVDRLLNMGEPSGFVLHGHGTGALKSAVRDASPRFQLH